MPHKMLAAAVLVCVVASCKPQDHDALSDGISPTDAPPAGPSLMFSVQPTSSLAGAALAPAVVVTIHDADDSAETSSSATVTITDSFGLLQGTTSVDAIDGVATFDNLYLLQAASGYRLTATTTGHASATSAPFDITLAVPSTLSLFGLDKNQQGSPLPTTFGLERLWNSGVEWSVINPHPHKFTYTALESYLSDLHAHHVDQVLYTIGYTPAFAQTAVAQFPSDVPPPDPASCRGAPGECFPPNDLNWDGTGSNAQWKEYITALASHVHDLDDTYAKIHYWEIWNEPDASPTLIDGGPKGAGLVSWWGSYAQLVRMAEDARCIIKGVGTIHNDQSAGSERPCGLTAIDPDAVILSPSAHPYPGTNGKHNDLSVAQNFLHCAAAPNTTLAPPPSFSGCTTGSWGSDAVDAINMHMKIADDALGPEYIQSYVAITRTILNPAELVKPIYNDEAGYGDMKWKPFSYSYDEIKEAFVGRFYFLQWGNVALVDWFTWENVTGADDYPCGLFDRPANVINGAGIAYATTFGWISGATLTKPCSSSVVDGDTVWTCGFTRAGSTYEAIWDVSVPCDGVSTCGTTNVPVDAPWTSYQDITGATHPIVGGVIPIGKKVIVLATR